MPVESVYDIGDSTSLTYTLRNASGILANASVAGTLTAPDGSQTHPAITNPATGMFGAQIAFSQAGRWRMRFDSTGPIVDSETVDLVVRPNAPVRSDDAYASVDDVIRICPGRTFSASSKPNTSDVVDWIGLAAGELDMQLRAQGYETPVPTTATAARRYLADANAWGAKLRLESSAAGGKPDAAKEARAMWDSFQKAIANGGIELPTGRDAAQSRPRHGAIATAHLTMGDVY